MLPLPVCHYFHFFFSLVIQLFILLLIMFYLSTPSPLHLSPFTWSPSHLFFPYLSISSSLPSFHFQLNFSSFFSLFSTCQLSSREQLVPPPPLHLPYLPVAAWAWPGASQQVRRLGRCTSDRAPAPRTAGKGTAGRSASRSPRSPSVPPPGEDKGREEKGRLVKGRMKGEVGMG